MTAPVLWWQFLAVAVIWIACFVAGCVAPIWLVKRRSERRA